MQSIRKIFYYSDKGVVAMLIYPLYDDMHFDNLKKIYKKFVANIRTDYDILEDEAKDKHLSYYNYPVRISFSGQPKFTCGFVCKIGANNHQLRDEWSTLLKKQKFVFELP